MFVYIILLWILINMSAPTWTYVLLGIAAFITIIKWGIDLAKKNEWKANFNCKKEGEANGSRKKRQKTRNDSEN